jgi:A118 family predicted phage portal protein
MILANLLAAVLVTFSGCAIATRSVQTENDKNYYYTLLEFHEWVNGKYIISNELYKYLIK